MQRNSPARRPVYFHFCVRLYVMIGFGLNRTERRGSIDCEEDIREPLLSPLENLLSFLNFIRSSQTGFSSDVLQSCLTLVEPEGCGKRWWSIRMFNRGSSPLPGNFVCVFSLPLPRVSVDPRHAKQWIKAVPKQQPPGRPEKTDRHRAEGQTGCREHDPDVLQRILQGTAHLTGCVKSVSSSLDTIITRFDSLLDGLSLFNCIFIAGMYLTALLESLV